MPVKYLFQKHLLGIHQCIFSISANCLGVMPPSVIKNVVSSMLINAISAFSCWAN